jgi:methionyl-tRNA formyltransferase
MVQHTAETKPKILVMTAGGPNPWMVINALHAQFDVHVLLEEPESKLEIFQRRKRRFGTVQAFGQVATMALTKLIRQAARRRTEEICRIYQANPGFNPSVPVTAVRSINSSEALDCVQQLHPVAILLISTRLMKGDILQSLTMPVLNLHAGINPAYRGQMGGYWALARGDRQHFGATAHLVDEGTDTGAILYQVRVEPSPSDFISTYPMLLTAAALEITCKAVTDAVTGQIQAKPASGPSELHFPPTVWRWLWIGITKSIW